jgi:hypothetical protein
MKASAMNVEADSILQVVARLATLSLVRLAAFGALGFAVVFPVHAALGGPEASVFADQSQINATLRTVSSAKYTMHELQVPSGTTVREYVAPTGTVFGIAWAGPSMPDLRQLLGTHFDDYVAALAARRTVRGPVLIQLPGLVVQSGGRMRAFSGKAYVPEGLPQGMSADDVK